MAIKVVCVNAKNKPSDFPSTFWIEEEELYTVTKVQKMAAQKNAIAFVLAEITLPEDCTYDSFLASRFRLASEDDLLAAEALEEAKKILENAEIGDLILV